MSFIHDDFLLTTKAARRLYHEFAENEPIYDYHTHLPVDEIARDQRFETISHIWLGGDHYKWRAMRANGIPESHVTGSASWKDKFLAFAKTVPHTLRNPLYHWTALELKRFFGIDELLSEKTAENIWARCNEQLATPEFSCRNLLTRSQVRVVCSTDDPTDSLEHHKAVAGLSGFNVKAYPTFRPDAGMRLEDITVWNTWTDKLASVSGEACDNLDSFLLALRKRHDFFHAMGGRLSDHGLSAMDSETATDGEAKGIFDKARTRQAISASEVTRFRSYLMLYFGQLDAEKGWTKQLHLGALRNANTHLFEKLGRDVGCDSPDDPSHASGLKFYLDTLEQRGHLPKVVLYNLNPKDNYVFASIIGNYQGNEQGIAGRLQFGSGWWFLDTMEGMEWQINALSSTGLLSRFVGMLTDSRSFLSPPRHEYFRRILCNLVGKDMDNGLLPDDYELVGTMIKRICYANAQEFFGMDVAGS
ncbi:MAG: glucuronate isomerase [Verrucomicrobiota bacterium]